MSLFFTVFLSVYALLNGYLAWRIATLPLLAAQVPPRLTAAIIILLAACFPASWYLRRWQAIGAWADWIGTTWMGTFLLLLTCFLLVEVITLGGWALASRAPALRQIALIAGLVMAAVALVQARRTPALVAHDVVLQDLPAERDGFRLVVASDLHLGRHLGVEWLGGVIDRIHEQKPDAVALVGDLIDSDAAAVQPMVPALSRLKAPSGVFAVIGNHEYYAGERPSAQILEASGFRALRNESVMLLPGLRIAGIDDLTVAGRNGRLAEPLLRKALAGATEGATVLLSHTPGAYELAAELGADLVLSGHTHDGQIWPFRYLVMTRFPHTYGFKRFGDMQAFVTRGVGTWGPRMRLWARGEIVVLTLRAPGKT